jgi:hypothetical protein
MVSAHPWQGFEHLEPRYLLAAISWDGGGGDLSWHNPLNWSGDVLPGPDDDVTINVPGSPAITHNSGQTTVRSLTCTEELELTSGSTLSVQTIWRQIGFLEVNNATVAGACDLLLSADAAFSNGGAISGTGKVILFAGNTAVVEGSFTLSRNMTNAGTLRWSTGLFTLDSTLTTLPGAAVQIIAGGLMRGNGTFINGGVLTKSSASNGSTTIAVTFSNQSAFRPAVVSFPPPGTPDAGLVDVFSGTLMFTGNVLQKQGSTLVSGHWRASSGAGTLLLPGPFITSVSGGDSRLATITLMGEGSQFPQIATAAFITVLHLIGSSMPVTVRTEIGHLYVHNAGVTGITNIISVLQLDIPEGHVVLRDTELHSGSIAAGATLTLTGAATFGHGPLVLVDHADMIVGGGTLRLAGALHMIGGSIEVARFLIAPGGRLDIDFQDPPIGGVQSRILNYGTINWTGSLLRITSELVNRGIVNLLGSGFIETSAGISSMIAPAWFHNFGTLSVQNGAQVTFRGAGGGVRFVNARTVSVQSGRLQLFGGVAGGGNWNSASTAEIVFGGLDARLTHATMAAGGRIRIGANLRFESGGITGAGDLYIGPTGRLNLVNQSSTPGRNNLIVRSLTTNTGVIDVEGTAEIRSPLRNSGTVALGGTLATERYVPFASSVLRIRSRADQQNGLLHTVNGGYFGGTLVVDFFWQPPVGNVFTVYSTFILNQTGGAFASFANVIATGLPPGRGVEFFTVTGQQTTGRGNIRVT